MPAYYPELPNERGVGVEIKVVVVAQNFRHVWLRLGGLICFWMLEKGLLGALGSCHIEGDLGLTCSLFGSARLSLRCIILHNLERRHPLHAVDELLLH